MNDTVSPQALPSRRQFVIGALAATAVAVVALVFFVLPAELGVDVTGFGKASGLTGLAANGPAANIYLERGRKRARVLFPLDTSAKPDAATLRRTLKGAAPNATLMGDHWQYQLLPYESIEMKYRLAQGQPMIFAWKATAPVHFDEHSVPDRGGNPMTESYVIADAATQTAVYVAPFTGIHGWFWQNQSLDPVTVTIDATGAFTAAVIFNQAGEHPRALQPSAMIPD